MRRDIDVIPEKELPRTEPTREQLNSVEPVLHQFDAFGQKINSARLKDSDTLLRHSTLSDCTSVKSLDCLGPTSIK